MYALTITFADHKNNASLNSAARHGKRARNRLHMELNSRSPRRPRQDHLFSTRQNGKDGFDIEDTKCITAEELQFLFSEPIAAWIERGRKKCPDVAA